MHVAIIKLTAKPQHDPMLTVSYGTKEQYNEFYREVKLNFCGDFHDEHSAVTQT